tara:strand:+ start:61 stop:477 length:417 start_codon:yes stop_codon:yes gene_type:complete
MNNWQKVINVCFAVIVTLLIFQNQQLKDQVGNILFDQILNKDVLSMRIDNNAADLLSYYRSQSKDSTLYDLGELVSKIQKLDAKQDKEIASMTKSIRQLPKPKSVETIRKIVEGCTAPRHSAHVATQTWNHGHKSLKC